MHHQGHETTEVGGDHSRSTGVKLWLAVPHFQNSVNEVRHAESEPEEVDGVNMVNNRFKKRFNLGPKKPQGNANFSRPTPKPATTPKNICFYHEKYGEYAKKCNEACKFFDANRFSGNGQAGHKQ